MISFAVWRPDVEARARDLLLGAAATAWLCYTFLYPALSRVHAVIPPCPFLLLTGHPCPFCGGTRSFSAMWRGDFAGALRLYPLGPLLFAVAFPVVVYGVWALATGRSLRLTLSHDLERKITLLGVAAILTSWALKLVWLGN